MIAGLVLQLVSLFGLERPWGFMLFLVGGCSLVAVGVVLYLIHKVQLPGVVKSTSGDAEA